MYDYENNVNTRTTVNYLLKRVTMLKFYMYSKEAKKMWQFIEGISAGRIAQVILTN